MQGLSRVLDVFLAFLRVGVAGFGGGPAFVPLVEVEAVDNFRWMSEREFTDVLAMGNALPGPIATKLAGYIGFKVAGIAGAVAGVVGVTAPTLMAMLVLFRFYVLYKDLPLVESVLGAVRPVVVVLLTLLVVDMAPESIRGGATVAIAVAAFVFLRFLHFHPALVILLAVGFGIAFMR